MAGKMTLHVTDDEDALTIIRTISVWHSDFDHKLAIPNSQDLATVSRRQ